MRKVALISAVSALIGYAAVHFAFFAKPKSVPAPEAPAVQAHTEPVVLASVIDVMDTEPLLDTRPKESEGGALFDPQVVPASFTAPASVPPIPPATDDDEIDEAPGEIETAPFPRVVWGRPALDAMRVAWYGSEVLPRQVHLPFSIATPYHKGVGIGFYF